MPHLAVLTLGAILAAPIGSGRAASSEAPPLDAPPECIDAVGKDGLSPVLARGPRTIGTYRLAPGKPVVTPRMRLLATTRFMPDRLGSSTGEWLPGLSVVLIPEAERDGESYRNSVDQHGYDPLRIGTYRVTVREVIKTKAGPVVETVVEDLGCLEEYVHAPLAPGESKTFCVSTEGTRTYAFSTGHWYDQVARMYFLVSAGLAPDVQQEPGTKTPHGYITAQAWEREDGLPSWDDRHVRQLAPGAVLNLPAHQVEVVRVVLGKDTRLIDERVVTSGAQPVVSVLVRVTRKLKPSTDLIRVHFGTPL